MATGMACVDQRVLQCAKVSMALIVSEIVTVLEPRLIHTIQERWGTVEGEVRTLDREASSGDCKECEHAGCCTVDKERD